MIGPADTCGAPHSDRKAEIREYAARLAAEVAARPSLSAEFIADCDEKMAREMELRGKAEAKRRWQIRMAEALATKRRGGLPPPNPFRVSDNDENWDAVTKPGPRDPALSRESAVIDGLGQKRESDYVEHCMNTAGFIMPADAYTKSVRRRFVRFDQTTRLAMALVQGGARKPESRRNAPSILTLISQREIKLPITPRVNFLPETAAARRSPMLKEVETYAARNPLARMATFTAGQRVPLPEIRERTSDFTRKISRLNSEEWFKNVATIPFRAVEFGTFKLCAKTFDWTVHIHAHTIFHPHRYTKPKKWRKFCRRVSAFMGAHWDGGRPIENAREMVKYPVKPADLENLLKVGGVEPVCEFYRQTKGLRLVETLGKLRVQRSSLKNTKRRRLKERNAEGEWLPTVRRSWNSQGRSVTKAALRAKRQRTAATEKFRAGMENLQGFCTLPEPSPSAPKMINRIVARLAPAPFASRVYEPAAFVWNFDGNWDAITGHRCIQRAIEAVRPQVELALELADCAERRAAAGGHNSSHQSHNCPAEQVSIGLVNAPPDSFRRHLEAVAL